MSSTSHPPMISLLTDDLLARILDNLPDPSDKKSFRAVCKAFHSVESDHRTQIRILRPEFLPSLLSHYPHVHTLDLSVCPSVDNATMSRLLHGVSGNIHVKKLILRKATGLRYSGLEIMMGFFSGLVAVDMSHCCDYGDREAAAISRVAGGGLREVRMDKCLKVTDVGLAKIAVKCGERLEKVSLKWCMEISDMGIDLLSKKCPHLKHLDISYLKVSNEALGSIGCLKKLEVLVMVSCGLVDDVGLHYLANGCPMLQVLDVSRCQNVSSSGIFNVLRQCQGLQQLNASYCFLDLSTTILSSLKELKNLKAIRINGARMYGYGFHMIKASCMHLVEIGLGKCKGVNDNGVIQLVSGCPNVKILDLTCCDALTDVAISSVADSCRNLLCLKLESCSLLTEKSLKYLGSCCFLLKELDLTDCCGVNDQGLNFLSECSELLSLKLGLCTNITDNGLSYLTSNCKKIRDLDLYRCTNIGDNGLAALAGDCKKLRKLNLSYCIEVTDKGMEHLSNLVELFDLELRGLHKVTDAGLTVLASGCKNLAELDVKHCENIGDSGFWSLAYYSRNLQQVNISYCAISDVGLCILMGNLTCLQNVKLVSLSNVTANGFELALRACCGRVKKVKLLNSLRHLLSPEIVKALRMTGCRIRWD